MNENETYYWGIINTNMYMGSHKLMRIVNFVKQEIEVHDWIVHWIDYQPHVNFITEQKITKYKWKKICVAALKDIGHTNPTKPYAYFKEVKNQDATMNYIYQCGRVLCKQELPPFLPKNDSYFGNNNKWQFCQRKKKIKIKRYRSKIKPVCVNVGKLKVHCSVEPDYKYVQE